MLRQLCAGISALALCAGGIPANAYAEGSVIRVKKSKKTEPEKTEPKPIPEVVGRPPPPPPPAAAPPRKDLVPAVRASTDRPSVAPWVTLTGSLIVCAIGAFFTVRTFQAIDEDTEIEINAEPGERVKLPKEFKDQQKRVLGNGIAATVLLSTGAAGTIASLVMLSSD